MDSTTSRRPSVRLDRDEAWATVAASHTGIFTSLRRDGMPITLPVWFVAFDHAVYMVTPAGTKKVARVRHDGRASFLVESGERWAELRAVMLTGRAEIVAGDDELAARVREAMNAKYASYRTAPLDMPEATRRHYGASGALIRFVPDDRILSWDNACLDLT